MGTATQHYQAPNAKARNLRYVGSILKRTLSDWSQDDMPTFAASLALYTLLSLGPLVMVSIALVGLVVSNDIATSHLLDESRRWLGPSVSDSIQNILASGREEHGGASLVGVAVALVGASGVFSQLQSALNRVWRVKARPGSAVLTYLRDRTFSFCMVLVLAAFLLASLLAGTALTALKARLAFQSQHAGALAAANDGLAFVVCSALFLLLFMFVPDIRVSWKAVLPGALLTGFLFILGKVALTRYLASAAIISSFGAAASLAALSIWVYYSAQIVLFGAEFTRVYAEERGGGYVPSKHAERVV
jgi:membrane protein